jgi:hypothetical protein
MQATRRSVGPTAGRATAKRRNRLVLSLSFPLASPQGFNAIRLPFIFKDLRAPTTQARKREGAARPRGRGMRGSRRRRRQAGRRSRRAVGAERQASVSNRVPHARA